MTKAPKTNVEILLKRAEDAAFSTDALAFAQAALASAQAQLAQAELGPQ